MEPGRAGASAPRDDNRESRGYVPRFEPPEWTSPRIHSSGLVHESEAALRLWWMKSGRGQEPPHTASPREGWALRLDERPPYEGPAVCAQAGAAVPAQTRQT